MLTTTELLKDKVQVQKSDWFLFLPFFLVAAFPIFWQLNATPIILWDEARLAMNAAEMLETGDLLVTYYGGEADLWNTKPPLQIWLIALSVKVFGYTEFGLRFPSAMAGVITLLLVYLFCRKVLKNNWAGIFSMLVLATSQGYVGFHVTRNGDYDALLVLFTTAYSLLYFTYLEKPKAKYLLWFGILLGLAVLTKSVAGLLFTPALVVYTLIQGKLLLVLRRKELYLAILLFLLLVAGFYLTRELLAPGYLQRVYENELGGRYLETLENHAYPADYFLTNLLEWRFVPWVFLLPIALLVLGWQPDRLIKRFALFGTLVAVSFLAIISSSQTKLDWYDAPVYPILAILTGLGLAIILQSIAQAIAIKPKQQLLFFTICTILIFWAPFNLEIKSLLRFKVQAPAKYWESYYGFTLKELTRELPDRKQITLLYTPSVYNPAMEFYKKGYEQKGYVFPIIDGRQLNSLGPDELVVTCEANLRDQVMEQYETEPVYLKNSCGALKIIRKK